ncbi:MAG: SAM-dependent methyltransferase [Alloprevotella sp.]|nr:SAM-dependent methyltransferase [Alloprevotella sp.]
MTADEFIRQHAHEPIEHVAFSLRQHPEWDAQYILRQIEGRQRLERKAPSIAKIENLIFPPRLSIEQCSGETAAQLKAQLVEQHISSRHRMADLTGGLGIDFASLAPLFDEAYYIERQEVLVNVARHNLPLMGVPEAHVVQADASEWLTQAPLLDLVFLDPARRDSVGRKVAGMADCEPNVLELLPLLRDKARYALLKLSPMLDLSSCLRDLPMASEVHIIAEKGECKELLVLLDFQLDRDAVLPDETAIFCHDGFLFQFSRSEEKSCTVRTTNQVFQYLYEPSAALLKAGAFKVVATRLQLLKLHQESHLYTSQALVNEFPGRTFRVLRTTNFSKKALREFTKGVKQANLSVRNFPATVTDLRKRLHLAEGGKEYWFATTLSDGSHVLIACEKV